MLAEPGAVHAEGLAPRPTLPEQQQGEQRQAHAVQSNALEHQQERRRFVFHPPGRKHVQCDEDQQAGQDDTAVTPRPGPVLQALYLGPPRGRAASDGRRPDRRQERSRRQQQEVEGCGDGELSGRPVDQHVVVAKHGRVRCRPAAGPARPPGRRPAANRPMRRFRGSRRLVSAATRDTCGSESRPADPWR